MPGLSGRRSAALAGLLVATIIALPACQADLPSPTPTRGLSSASPQSALPGPEIDLTRSSYKAEVGKDGGSAVIGSWEQANQFNPYYLGQGTERAVAATAWATLVTVSHDHRYLPDLAAAVPTVDNGGVMLPGEGGDAMTVSWTLREGLKWSDGEALTCDDFKYAWEWVLDGNNFGVVTAGFEDIENLDCKSDTEMVWHFGLVYEGYLTLMTAPLPRHFLGAIPMDQQTQGVGFRPDEVAKLPVSGPFRFESVTPATELRMAKNPNYTSPGTASPAHLDSLTFRWYADPAALIAAYRTGKVDVATGLAIDDLAGLADLGDAVLSRPSLTYETLRPNWSQDSCSIGDAVRNRGDGCPMADTAVRQAVALAIDRPAIVGGTVGGIVQVAGTNVDPQAWFYDEQPAPAFDPAEARQILEGSGWTDPDADGIREKDGLEARIEVCTTDRQARLDTVALVAARLKDVGIEATLKVAAPDDMFATFDRSGSRTPCALERGHFDLALHSLSSSIDPRDYYFKYHSSQFEPDGQNDASVNNVGIDVALETAKGTVHPAVIRDAMIEFQEIYVEQTVEIPLYFIPSVEVHAAKLGNVVGSSPLGGATWNAADWFVRG